MSDPTQEDADNPTPEAAGTRQEEMPFAIVDGRPMSQLPDLRVMQQSLDLLRIAQHVHTFLHCFVLVFY